MRETKICVIGLGYVGLPIARLFSTKYKTIGFDICESRVDALMKGHDDMLEVSDELLQTAIKNGFVCTSRVEDIKIQYVGLRPGEKLYEELLSNEENTVPTVHKKIFLAKVRKYDYNDVKASLDKLMEATITMDKEATVAQMKEIVPEFKSCNSRYGRLDK